MYTIVHFSPTGNTKYLAIKLKEALKDNVVMIDLISEDIENINQDDELIIMCPIHAFNVPKEVVSFVKKLDEDKFKFVSIISVGCTDAWINDCASMEIRNILNKKNYVIKIDRVLEMPLTLVKEMPTTITEKMIKKSENEIKNIAIDIQNNKLDNKIISNKSKLINKLGKIEKQGARVFGLELYADNNCISCGKCIKDCPSKNIQLNKNKPKFKFNCSMCLRCIYECPQKSIKPRISKFIPIKDGYKRLE